MFFIVAGACEVLVGSTELRVAVLVEKQFFGESALLMPEGQVSAWKSPRFTRSYVIFHEITRCCTKLHEATRS